MNNRDANRQQFPKCAKFIDEMRKHFGSVTVHYVREQGKEKGKPMNGDEDAK
jgi:hypothetical protein